jgi:AhpD family alkylhydroperoxidase
MGDAVKIKPSNKKFVMSFPGYMSIQVKPRHLKEIIMQARMSNPATIFPDAMNAIQALLKATRKGGVPSVTLELVHLRASQINGCSFCIDSGARSARKAGETDERLFTVVAWREHPTSLMPNVPPSRSPRRPPV